MTPDVSGESPYGPGLHRLAVVVACAVLPLVVVGASVTSKDAGMAYPDGFHSSGYVISNPPGWWDKDDTRWEHGHRVLGKIVGLLAISLAIWCWPRGGVVRRLGVINLTAICVQGVFGALRVDEISTTLAMVHGVFGQLCFCLACSVVLVTGRTWREGRGSVSGAGSVLLQRLCLVGAVCVLLQLVAGAAQRHFASQTTLIIHILGAMPVTFLVGWIAMWVMGQQSGPRLFVLLGRVLAVLMAIQLLLGGAAFLVTVMGASKSALLLWAVPTAHVVVGALLLVSMVMLTMCAYHLLRPAKRVTSQDATMSISTI